MRPITIISRLLFFLIVLLIALNVQSVLFAQDMQAKPGVSGAAPDEISPVERETEPASPTAGSSGMKVYKDPVTGEFLDAPPEKVPLEMPEAAEEAISTSHEGLEIRKVDKPGGGVMIDLKGRFQQYQTVTKDPDGNITIRCTPEVPAPTGNNEKDVHQTTSHDEQE